MPDMVSMYFVFLTLSRFGWRRKWQPIPVFLPGESQGQRRLVGCHLWGCTELDTTEVTQRQQIWLASIWYRCVESVFPKEVGLPFSFLMPSCSFFSLSDPDQTPTSDLIIHTIHFLTSFSYFTSSCLSGYIQYNSSRFIIFCLPVCNQLFNASIFNLNACILFS